MHTRRITVKDIDYDIPITVWNMISRFKQRYSKHIARIEDLTKTVADLNSTIQRQNEEINKIKQGE